MSAIALIGIAACVYVPQLLSYKPRKSEAEITRLADQAATVAGLNLDEYAAQKPQLVDLKKFQIWSVYYFPKYPNRWQQPTDKPKSPLKMFVAYVDDNTGRTQIKQLETGSGTPVPLPRGMQIMRVVTNE